MKAIRRMLGQPDQDNPWLVELRRRMSEPGGAQLLKGITPVPARPQSYMLRLPTPFAEDLWVTDETYAEIKAVVEPE